MNYFENFCRQFIRQRKESSEGRTSDFMNLMLKSEISPNEKSSATRSRFELVPVMKRSRLGSSVVVPGLNLEKGNE